MDDWKCALNQSLIIGIVFNQWACQKVSTVYPYQFIDHETQRSWTNVKLAPDSPASYSRIWGWRIWCQPHVGCSWRGLSNPHRLHRWSLLVCLRASTPAKSNTNKIKIGQDRRNRGQGPVTRRTMHENISVPSSNLPTASTHKDTLVEGTNSYRILWKESFYSMQNTSKAIWQNDKF